MKPEQVAEMVESHVQWFNDYRDYFIEGSREPWKKLTPPESSGKRADFTGADLTGYDFRAHKTSGFQFLIFDGANLTDANLSNKWLYRASFIGATLCRTNLRGAFLRQIDASSAHFEQVNLSGMIFYDETFSGASFIDCNLTCVEFRRGARFSLHGV